MECPNCQRRIPEMASLCPRCGFRLRDSVGCWPQMGSCMMVFLGLIFGVSGICSFIGGEATLSPVTYGDYTGAVSVISCPTLAVVNLLLFFAILQRGLPSGGLKERLISLRGSSRLVAQISALVAVALLLVTTYVGIFFFVLRPPSFQAMGWLILLQPAFGISSLCFLNIALRSAK